MSDKCDACGVSRHRQFWVMPAWPVNDELAAYGKERLDKPVKWLCLHCEDRLHMYMRAAAREFIEFVVDHVDADPG